MCRRLSYLLVLSLVLAGSGISQAGVQKWESTVRAANPLHWYRFNEAFGATTANDLGSGGLNGSYRSLVELAQQGCLGAGEAVRFEAGGQTDVMYTQGGNVAGTEWTAEFILMKMSATAAQALCDSSGYSLRLVGYASNEEFGYTQYGVIDARFTSVAGGNIVAPVEQWIHVVYRRSGSKIDLFVDGVLVGTGSTLIDCPIDSFGGRAAGDSDGMNGFMDEAVIYDRALTDAEIAVHAAAPFVPDVGAVIVQPADGAIDVPRDTVLSWIAGTYAQAHDVYLGTALDDVNNASASDPRGVLVSQGQTDTTYDPASGLEYGQTYYWRIDEVNGAPDHTVFKGDLWSFTVEPYAYPITSLTVEASSQQAASPAIRTIDGSGLDEFDQHSTDSKQMWSTSGGLPAWIQYTFDKEYKLYELWVWNANSDLEQFLGFGAKDVTIEYSTDGEIWTPLENVPEFAQGISLATYTANTIVDLGGVVARHVRLTINDNWGATALVSLSEVRFLYTAVQAFEPAPANGAAEISLDATLSWRAGREATSHEVYLDADANAVAEGTVAAETVTDNSFTPGAMDFGTTYYWKVDEVGDAGTYEGEVWSFTTREFAPIDDFESYTDDIEAGTTIWHAWIDGMSSGASGSQVGYDDSPFAETTIIHGGKQSMPLAYDNDGTFREGTQFEKTGLPFYSQAEREFDPTQNWTGNGATDVGLWVRGYPVVTPVEVSEAAGKMTLVGTGADIWGNSDEFVYAYKTLTGDGTMVARVTSNGTGASTWAKGGVMIRDSLNGGSTHAMMVITGGGGNGASFQYRDTTNGTSGNADSAAVVAPPYWVKIDRSGDMFTGYSSADGKSWTMVGSVTIPMTAPVQIGVIAVSTVAGEYRTFEFDSITGTGTITGAWQGVLINSPRYNAAANMSLTLSDSAGKSATATNATIVTSADWTRWTIPMSDFAGVNFAKVKKMVITIGDKTATAAGGTGIVFIDDIGFGHAAE
ncbi:MAG: LamG-like jellyroll fold domain-containing protein [Phycisphaerales bacterium]